MTPLYHPRPERWPQFSLGGMLIVVTLVALLMPWAASEYRVLQLRRQNRIPLEIVVIEDISLPDAIYYAGIIEHAD